MKTNLLFLQLIFGVPAIAQQNDISVTKTVIDTVSGQKTIVKKRCFEHKEVKKEYEDFVTTISIFDKDNTLVKKASLIKNKGIRHRNYERKQIIKYFPNKRFIVGLQVNNKKIRVTEYVNGKKTRTQKFENSELYWEDWFEHYDTICAN